MEGLEPPHPFGYQILSLARLPFRHIGTHGLPTTDVSNGKYYARTEGKGKAIRTSRIVANLQRLDYREAQHGRWHYGPELGQSIPAKAERLIRKTLQAAGLTEPQVLSWPKGPPFKVRLRAETTVTLDRIAQRLRMGTGGRLVQLLFH